MKSTIQQSDKNTNRWLMLAVSLQWLAIIGIWAALLLNNWKSLPFTAAWNISDRKAGKADVMAVTIDSDGSPWFVIQKHFGVGYQVRHVMPERTDSWDLPPMAYIEMSRASLAKDKNNNPWLILGKRLAHWNGNEWDFIPTPLDAEILDLVCPTVAIKGSMVWGIDYETEATRIIHLDLSDETIEAQEILLPDDLDPQQDSFHCIISTGNTLLVVLSSDSQTSIYQLQNLEWQKITSFQREQVPYWTIRDIALDTKGQIWISLMVPLYEKSVGKYDPTTNMWTWLNIERLSELGNRLFEFSHIAVDDIGRVWISATQYKTTGTILSSSNYETNTVGVFDERENTLVEVRHYTSKNSSLETSQVAKVLVGPDGRIWTWNQQLVWMDSTQPDLPTPLPGWFVTLADHRATISLMIASLFMTSLVFVVQVILKRRRQNLPKR